MGNLNLWEIVLLVVLAVVIFGPERLPELARKVARVLHFVRGIANNAQDSVRRELGPDYADLELADLQPKNLVKRMLAEDYDVIEAEIRQASGAARGGATEARAVAEASRREIAETAVVVAPSRRARYDEDAT